MLMVLPSLIHAQSSDDFSWQDNGQGAGADRVASTVAKFQAPDPASGSQGEWYGIAIRAILICLLANAVLFAYAKAMHSTTAERFAVSEFYQVSASALMILVLVAVLQQAFVFVDQYVLPVGTTTGCYGGSVDVWKEGPPAVIQCKLQEKIEYAEGLYLQASEINKGVEPLTTLCIYVMSVQSYCGDWDSALHSQMEQAHLLAHNVVPIAIGLHAQFSFMAYLARNMLEIFLPLGLVLRIFPFTRGIGGLLIAIAIAFFFVFPISYILLDPSTTRPNPTDLVPVNDAVLSPCFKTFSGAVNMITQLSAIKKQKVATPDASEVGKEIAKLQVEAFVIPLIALAISILFIQTITPILGGDSGEIMHFIAKVI